MPQAVLAPTAFFASLSRSGATGRRRRKALRRSFGGVYPREWAERQHSRPSGPAPWAWVAAFAAALAIAWQITGNWTDALIALNVVSFVVQCYNKQWEDQGYLTADTLRRPRSSHRLVLSAFLHAGWYHLGCNMASLWYMGRHVERVFGPGRFLLLYLGSLVVGALTSLWGKRRSQGGSVPTVGASAGVLGVVAALVVFRWRLGLPLQDLWLVLLLNLLVGLATPQADNLGHAGGAAGGALIAYLWGPRYVWLFGGLLYRDSPIITWPFS